MDLCSLISLIDALVASSFKRSAFDMGGGESLVRSEPEESERAAKLRQEIQPGSDCHRPHTPEDR
jgi:hypothetical protein